VLQSELRQLLRQICKRGQPAPAKAGWREVMKMGEMATDAIATMEEPKEETKNLNETNEAAEEPGFGARLRFTGHT